MRRYWTDVVVTVIAVVVVWGFLWMLAVILLVSLVGLLCACCQACCGACRGGGKGKGRKKGADAERQVRGRKERFATCTPKVAYFNCTSTVLLHAFYQYVDISYSFSYSNNKPVDLLYIFGAFSRQNRSWWWPRPLPPPPRSPRPRY